MELDLSEYRLPIIAMAAILLLAAMAWLGYAYLPSGDRILTYSEWQVLKARRAYWKELNNLRAAAETLAALLNAPPDPVRAQISAENIQRLTSEGQPALQYQRDKLAIAAQAVSDWAVGAADREQAQQVLEESIRSLSTGSTPEQTPFPTPTSVNFSTSRFVMIDNLGAVYAG